MIVKSISGSFIEMNFTIKDPLEQLVQGGFAITVSAIDDCHLSVC